MQTDETLLATRGSAGVEDALTDVGIQSVPLLEDQVYECIFQMATMVYEQIAQKLYGLRMEAGKMFAIFELSLDCVVAMLLVISSLMRSSGLSKVRKDVRRAIAGA